MTFNNFTIKAQEAIQKAIEVASAHQSQAVDDVHLLKGLQMADEHVLPFLFKKVEADPNEISRKVDARIESLPKVSGNGSPNHWAMNTSPWRPCCSACCNRTRMPDES